ncbi:larval cuticle protein LCP-22-like [Anoplophora glabripennis]|uniref:larval cuticle protein LCP-22-like n=1 Tax=Anoplophora glabripennis TaxID=217634 RepID=UPI000874C6FF|nr:larval cuticle protein LCP-22-like [Anoplophora glabripennis]
MIKLVFIFTFVVAGLAAPQYYNKAVTQRPVAILRSENDIYPDGSYKYAYDTENGISAQENGQPSNSGPDAGTAAQGSFQYTSPEGILVQIQYIADENGFQPVGNVLPGSQSTIYRTY